MLQEGGINGSLFAYGPVVSQRQLSLIDALAKELTVANPTTQNLMGSSASTDTSSIRYVET